MIDNKKWIWLKINTNIVHISEFDNLFRTQIHQETFKYKKNIKYMSTMQSFQRKFK